MQIPAWHAVSNSNTAPFTVIGVFETPEKAQAAQRGLTAHLRQITRWYEHPDNEQAAERWLNEGWQPPSPPELRVARELGIAWSEYSLDWLDYRGGPIFAFDRLLFVDGTGSWLGAQPADALVRHFGGKVFVDGALSTLAGHTATVRLNLTCSAPNAEAAEALAEATTGYLRREQSATSGELFDTPWREFAQRHAFAAYAAFNGQVYREGRRLRLAHGQFCYIADGLPALLTYLRYNDCSDIAYTLSETPAPGGDELPQ